MTFQKFKFKLLDSFPQLEQENYSINWNNNDITNIFYDETLLNDIFTHDKLSDMVKIIINTKPKQFVEFHKKCSFCHVKKAVVVCNKCAIASCNDCCNQDIHYASRNVNFISLINFKEYEQNTLQEYLNLMLKKKDENLKLQSNKFNDIINEKIEIFNKKFNEMIDLINIIKNHQYTNLVDIINLLKSYYPEKIETNILNLYNIIKAYKENPYYDSEESMKKVIELEKFLNDFLKSFLNYKTLLDSFTEKYLKCMKINNNILDNLKNSFLETKSVFKKSDSKEKFNLIMKIYDQKSVLVYNHSLEEFSLMNFIDKHNFKENYNNFIQINYGKKLFIITGNPCQKLYVYDYISNEMEYINSLKFSHNWWPVLLIKPSEDTLSKINLFCFSGTYTRKCEELIFILKNGVVADNFDKSNMFDQLKENKLTDFTCEWKEIQSLTNCHGQGAAFLFNESTVYILFGYDSKFNSTSSIEKIDLASKGNWEIVKFNNPNKINALLYYHSIMKCDNNTFYLLGGMKDINISDVIYKFNVLTNELSKTTYEIPLKETKFYNEKNFFCLNKELLSNQVVNLGKTMKLKNEESLQSLIDKEVSDNSTYGVFDALNNIHLINLKGFHYEIKQYIETDK